MIKEEAQKALRLFDNFEKNYWDLSYEDLKEFYGCFDKEYLLDSLCHMHLSISGMKNSLDRKQKIFSTRSEDVK